MKTKICPKCKTEKELNSANFGSDSKRITKFKPYCKVCTAELAADYYQRNKEKLIAQNYENTKKFRENKNKLKYSHFKEHPCVDCGETDPIVLEFDHVRGDKKFSIGSNNAGSFSMKTLQEEIDKCEVRCANCHKRKNARDFGWYKSEAKIKELGWDTENVVEEN